MTTFADNFWGSRNNGYFALYSNLKHGCGSVKELVEFLRESCTVEESYSKLLVKLARLAGGNSQDGTFGPFWNILRNLMEKLSSLQLQLVASLGDLLKEVALYHDNHHKRQKTMKEREQPTLDAVNNIQQVTIAVHKAKEMYHTRCMEVERLKRDTTSTRDLERAELKLKKALEDYKSLIEKYKDVRNDFERKMTVSCNHFQEVEEEFICQMKDFLDTFTKSWENEYALKEQIHKEFKARCDEMTVQKLLSIFIEKKGTGTAKPGPIEFVEPDLSNIAVHRPMSPDPSVDKKDTQTPEKPWPNVVAFSGFFRTKIKKTEEKNVDSTDKDKDGTNVTIEVDDEGYSIPPQNPSDKTHSKDSDSDSDEELQRPIKVEIRPMSPAIHQNLGTVDDIKASLGGMQLAPPGAWKKSQTAVDRKLQRSPFETNAQIKPDTGFLGVDLLGSSPPDRMAPSKANYNISLPSSLTLGTEVSWANGNQVNDSSSSITDVHILDGVIQPDGISNSISHPGRTDNSLMLPEGGTYNVIQPSGTSNKVVLSSKSSNSMIQPHGTTNSMVQPSETSSVRQLFSSLTSSSTSAGLVPLSNGVIQKLTNLDPKSPASGSTEHNVTSTQAAIVLSPRVNSAVATVGSVPQGLQARVGSPVPGMNSTIPLALAFTETINACFKGHETSKCMVRTDGNLMMSFPAGAIKSFMESPSPTALCFSIRNASKWGQVITNSPLLAKEETHSSPNVLTFKFNMSNLIDHLRQQGEFNRTAAYFNIDILKYQVTNHQGMGSVPLSLTINWTCNEHTSEFDLGYRYNPSAMSSPVKLTNLTVLVQMDGEINNMHSHPSGIWNAGLKRATWKLKDISDQEIEQHQGHIRAKFELTNGPIKPVPAVVQFAAEGATLSSADFELVSSGYRVSLLKRKFATGKYYVEPEQLQSPV